MYASVQNMLLGEKNGLHEMDELWMYVCLPTCVHVCVCVCLRAAYSGGLHAPAGEQGHSDGSHDLPDAC